MGVHSKTTKHITVYVDDEEFMKRVKIQAIKNDKSVSQFAFEAVKKAMEESEAKNGQD